MGIYKNKQMKEQLHRIQQKLSQAKEADKNLEVFGADAHQYHLNPAYNSPNAIVPLCSL